MRAAESHRQAHVVAVQGGKWLLDVSYLRRHDLWFATQRFSERRVHWNVFGIGKPYGSSPAVPEIQFNVAWSPLSQGRLSARFMTDDDGHTWIAHPGWLGGNKVGRTIDEFLRFYPRARVVQVDGKAKRLVTVGHLDAPSDLLAGIADIASAAESFRAQL